MNDKVLTAKIVRLEREIALLRRQLSAGESDGDEDGLDGSTVGAPVSRRAALAGLGAVGLLGLGVGSAEADPQGQVGTDTDPLQALYAREIHADTGNSLTLNTGGTRALELDVPTSDADGNTAGGNVVAGHPNNAVNGGAVGAVIGGGGNDTNPNDVYDEYGTVGGGTDNQAGSDDGDETTAKNATIGGGRSNTASGNYTTVGGGESNTASNSHTTVGGGGSNTASGARTTVAGGYNNEATANGATVGGGDSNSASDIQATVGGGENNVASDAHATVPGGRSNTASGTYSFAAGRLAKTESSGGTTWAGAFVWGDSSSQTVRADTSDQVVFQAGGGMKVYTDSHTSTNTGVALPAGSGSWDVLSSETAKSDVEAVNGPDALAAVESLDVATWRYDAEDQDVRHMGPMAEDFHDAFGLGHDEKRISTVDADGVALAAIQGLSQKLDERDERIDDLEATIEDRDDRLAELEAENDRLREQNADLEARLDRVEARIGLLDPADASVVTDG